MCVVFASRWKNTIQGLWHCTLLINLSQVTVKFPKQLATNIHHPMSLFVLPGGHAGVFDAHGWWRDPPVVYQNWWSSSSPRYPKGRHSWAPNLPQGVAEQSILNTWVNSPMKTKHFEVLSLKASLDFQEKIIVPWDSHCLSPKTAMREASMKRLRDLLSALIDLPHFLVPKHGSNIYCNGRAMPGTFFRPH